MSILSQDRQSVLSHKIVDDLINKKLLKTIDRDIVFKEVLKGLSQFVKEWDSLDKAAKEKIKSLKRNVSPFSGEWDILYNQYFEESYSRLSALFSKNS